MADEKKEVLLRIRVDEEAAKKRIVGFQKDINATKQAQKELEKAIKEAGGATEEQAAQQVELKAKLKDLTTQQNLQIKALENQRKADKAAEGSIIQLRAQLASLTEQWNSLSEEERDNTEIGKQLQEQTRAVSDRLKELEGSVGDTRRNVGNYTGSILQAIDGTGLIATITDKASQAQAAFTATLQLTRNGIGGNVSMLKLFRLALISTGIGAILVLLGGLVAWLTRTQEGIDWVSQKTKGLTTVFGVLIDYLSSIGKKVIDFVGSFENLGDAVKKLGTLLVENLMNRLKGFLVLWEGLKTGNMSKIQDAVVQVTTGITDATAKAKAFTKELNEVRKAGEAIEKENQRIRESERALNVEREKANAQIEKYKLVAEDTTKSESVRADAARKAYVLEEDLRNKQLKLQQDKIANIIAEQKLTNNLTADNDKLAEAQIELARIEKDSIGKSIELQNKLNALRKEGADKAREAAIKQLEAEAALLEIRTKSTLNSEEDMLNLRLQMLEKRRQIDLKAEGLTQAQVNVIKAKYLQEEAALREEFRNEQKTRELEETERQSKAAFELSQKLLQRGFDQQNLSLKEQRAQGLLSEQEYQQRLLNLQVTQMQAELLMLEQHKSKIPGIEEQIAAKRLEISNALADRQIENIDKVEAKEAERIARRQEQLSSELEMTGAFMTQIGQQLGSMMTAQGQEVEQFMASIATMVVDTIAQVLQAQVAASVGAATIGSIASPESIATAGVAGVAKALALVALINAAAAAAKGAIQKAVQPKQNQFYTGGYTGDGGKYEPAGIVHKGEVVFSQDDVKRAGGVYAVEAMRLRGYASGGIVSPTRTSLSPAVRAAMGSHPLAIDYDKLGAAVGRHVPKYIKTTDIKTGLAKDHKTASIANQ